MNNRRFEEIIHQLNNNTLTVLDLSDEESLDVSQFTVLEKALKNNTTLTSLNLRNANIDCDKARAIGRILQKNTSLLSLNLSYNHIGSQGANGISLALHCNKSLTELDVSHNAIYDAQGKKNPTLGGYCGLVQIISTLQVNSTIRTIKLQGNSGCTIQTLLGDLDRLISLLERNTSIETITIDNIHIKHTLNTLWYLLSAESATKLADALDEAELVNQKSLSFIKFLENLGNANRTFRMAKENDAVLLAIILSEGMHQWPTSQLSLMPLEIILHIFQYAIAKEVSIDHSKTISKVWTDAIKQEYCRDIHYITKKNMLRLFQHPKNVSSKAGSGFLQNRSRIFSKNF
jgi:hypothetical protein